MHAGGDFFPESVVILQASESVGGGVKKYESTATAKGVPTELRRQHRSCSPGLGVNSERFYFSPSGCCFCVLAVYHQTVACSCLVGGKAEKVHPTVRLRRTLRSSLSS